MTTSPLECAACGHRRILDAHGHCADCATGRRIADLEAQLRARSVNLPTRPRYSYRGQPDTCFCGRWALLAGNGCCADCNDAERLRALERLAEATAAQHTT